MNSKAHHTHPVVAMREASRTLRQQSHFAHKHAANGVQQAKNASAALAELDLEKVFRQLHQMVALVGGRTNSAGGRVNGPVNDRNIPLAAE